MKIKELFMTLPLILVVLMSGCKKDDYKATVGVCPIVVSTIPAKGAVGVPLNQVVSATFNETMNAATITATTFTVIDATKSASLKAAVVITGAITYSGMTATFTPTSGLLPSTTYTGRMTTAAKDPMGNALQTDYVWTFSTDVPPTVTSNPANNAVDIPLNKTIVATFSTPMDSLTFKTTGTTFIVKQGTTLVPKKLVYTSNTVSFVPTTALAPFTVYTGTITTAAKNTLGTPLAADYVWNFTTIPQLTLTANPVLGGTLTGSGTFAQGSLVTVVATANTGYTFFNWTDGVTVASTSASYQFAMAGNKTLVANFTPKFAVTVLSNPLLGGVTSGAGSFNPGASVTVTAVPNVGFTFTNWTEGVTIISTNATYVFTVAANRALTANYSAIPNFTVGVSANPLLGGVVTGGGSFISGASATVIATANVGFTFTNWTEGATIASTNATYLFPVTANRILVANFAAVGSGFTLNVTAVNGTVVKNPILATYVSGATVQLTATPNSGYQFSSWSVDATGTTNPLTVTMNSNKNITANFTATVLPPSGPLAIDLGCAAPFAVLAGSTITSTGPSIINGNVGLSPGSALIGFPPGIINGTKEITTPIADAAKLCLTSAYIDGQSRSLNAISLPGQLGGLTLAPGLYVNSSTSGISGTGANGILTLDAQGNANAVWIFKIGSTLTTDPATSIVLAGGAQAANIFWIVGTSATLGTTSVFDGNIMADQAITLNTGAVLNGRALARIAAVTLDASTITKP